jgi:hypothetical protein
MIEYKELSKYDIENLNEIFEDFDQSLVKNVIYFDGWCGYDDSAGVFIFQGIDDSIQMASYSTSCMSSDNTNYFALDEITVEQAIDIITEMNESIKNNDRSMDY